MYCVFSSVVDELDKRGGGGGKSPVEADKSDIDGVLEDKLSRETKMNKELVEENRCVMTSMWKL